MDKPMNIEDLDNVKKEFMATVGNNGRQLFLKGIAKSGSDYEHVSGFSVRDFLRQNSVMTIDLKHYEVQKLRGKVENGTNIYFWSKPK
jgi:hypothetical protein